MPSSMPIPTSCSSSASEPNEVVVLTREPAGVASKWNTIRIEGSSVFAVPSGWANPSRTSKECNGSTATHSQYPRETSPSGPVILYSLRPPATMSCRVNVAGYVGGPQNRSSWRGSAYASQSRCRGTSKSATTVMVSAVGSFVTDVIGMMFLQGCGLGSGDSSPNSASSRATRSRQICSNWSSRACARRIVSGFPRTSRSRP